MRTQRKASAREEPHGQEQEKGRSHEGRQWWRFRGWRRKRLVVGGNEDEGLLSLIPRVLGKESELPDQRALLVIGGLLLLVMRVRACVAAEQSLRETRGGSQCDGSRTSTLSVRLGFFDTWQTPRVKGRGCLSLMVPFSPSPYLPQLGCTFRDDCSNSKFIGLQSRWPFVAADEVSTSCRLCGNFVEVFVKTVTGWLSVTLMFAFYYF